MIKLGQRLSEERIRKGLSLKEISEATKIRESFLAAIEKGDYQRLPSVSYVQGFVRNYAKYLELPENEIMALFRREFDEEKVFKVLPQGLPKEEEISLSTFRVKQTIIMIGIVIVVIFSYILFQYRYAFIAPPLDVSYPKEMQVVSDQTITLLGKTDPNATVYVDKEAVSVDTNGNFTKTLSLFPGKTTITIKVINKFGKQTTLERNIMVKPSS